MDYHNDKLYTPPTDDINRMFKVESILKDKFPTPNSNNNDYSNLIKVNDMKMDLANLPYNESVLHSTTSYNMMIPLMYSEPVPHQYVDPYSNIPTLPHPNRTHSLCPQPSYSGKIPTAPRPRQYSFVAMSQHHQPTKKRLRRPFNEIDRIYACLHPGCTKSYGTLNNLNAHIVMQSHGKKRCAADYSSYRRP